MRKEIEMELYGKLRYIGKVFFLALTNGKIYDCVGVGHGMLRIVDDEEDYLYSAKRPRAATEHEYEGGRWEVVEIERTRIIWLMKEILKID